jgi:hypothetical protein
VILAVLTLLLKGTWHYRQVIRSLSLNEFLCVILYN